MAQGENDPSELNSVTRVQGPNACGGCDRTSAPELEAGQMLSANITVARRPPRLLVTPVFIALCAAVYIAMVMAKVSPTHPTATQLLRWGANFGPLTLGGQYWRLLSSAFLHIGFIHLALNMWCLWNLGAVAEPIWGRIRFAFIYLVAGVAGAIVSVAWHPFVPGAGASGAIFGVAGALIVYLTLGDLPFPREVVKATLGSLVAFAVYNLIFGFILPGIDNAAHLGGLLAGLVMGFLLARRVGNTRLLIAVPLLLALAFFWVSRARGYVPHIERGRAALAAGKTEVAITELTTAIRQNPNFADSYLLLADAYLRNSQPVAAENCLRDVIKLKPYNGEVRWQLGLLVASQGRSQEALDIFSELTRLQPWNANGYIGISMASLAQGNYELALTNLRRASELSPNDPEVHLQHGAIALRLKHNDEAIAALSRSIQLQPRNPNALFRLAEAYRAKGMQSEAEAAYNAARRAAQR